MVKRKSHAGVVLSAKDPDHKEAMQEQMKVLLETGKRYIEAVLDPSRINKQNTVLDLRRFIEAHPEESHVTEEDRMEILKLPEATRDRLLKLFKLSS